MGMRVARAKLLWNWTGKSEKCQLECEKQTADKKLCDQTIICAWDTADTNCTLLLGGACISHVQSTLPFRRVDMSTDDRNPCIWWIGMRQTLRASNSALYSATSNNKTLQIISKIQDSLSVAFNVYTDMATYFLSWWNWKLLWSLHSSQLCR